MASVKPPSTPQDNTGSTLLAQYPPRITLDSPLLASAIPLQESPLIAYAVFSGGSSTGADNLICIEHARRSVLARNTGCDILSSLLPAVHISRDTAALFVFAFGSSHQNSGGTSALAALQLEDLIRECSHFCLLRDLCPRPETHATSQSIRRCRCIVFENGLARVCNIVRETHTYMSPLHR